MFLFSKKHKTPISTYTDSYRPPCSVRKNTQERALQELWKENKFVTKGLTAPPVQNPASQGPPSQLVKLEREESFRKTIDHAAYWPEKYWLARSEGMYNPVFVNEDKYISWRTGPYHSTAWNNYSSYLTLLPKETRMETCLHRPPVLYPLKSTCLRRSGWLLLLTLTLTIPPLADVLHLLPSLQPVYTVTGRRPFHSYYSPCSGRHYCLQGIDYYSDAAAAIRRHLHEIEETAEPPILQLQPQSSVLYTCTSPPAILSIQEP
ncbi:Spermatid-specific manchette-related protein 1 [Antrostomus carolinensis]|uniref:Spermatid-specific manchette-related protein 1 n=1 Tax=Antrostomus carolinensis TaxID=279965 RepID=A0A094K804_ANTCR|nr:Spermatid-specific manchette-related protein 1 [Antrostomus carolinensis]